MIPAPLTTPVDVRPRSGVDRHRLLRWAGVVLLVLAVFGGVVWAGAYSPFGYQRFDVFDQGRVLDLRQGGTYTVYEEFDGASDVRLPTPVEVVVRREDGEVVAVTPAQAPGERAAPDAYDSRWHEGRALATFEVDDGGRYVVQVEFLEALPGQYRAFERVTIAVARQPTFDWLAGPLGAVVLAGVPAALGVMALLVAWRGDRTAGTGG